MYMQIDSNMKSKFFIFASKAHRNVWTELLKYHKTDLQEEHQDERDAVTKSKHAFKGKWRLIN